MAKRKPDPEPNPPAAAAEYTVVARRYRPQQFQQLIGQEATAQALENALTNERVAHAYLFTGARGVGKTSCARILAKALNCAKGPTPTPCDSCEICQSIMSGDDVDVLEIDGASNRGIDEVRDLRANVQFRPARARYKIYIIDEVHMLTKPAFNALLKTLEEPPPGVKFIFATTDVSDIPVTILSRCQRFDFGLIRPDAIAGHLRSIVAQEKLEADSAAIELLARRSGGSMRDAESLLDQLMSFGERVTTGLVHRMLGTAPADRIAAIAAAIVINRSAKEAVDALHLALRDGSQIGEVLDQLVELWRDLMLLLSCGKDAPSLTNSLSDLQPLAEATSLDAVMAGLDVLAATKSRLKYTGFSNMLLEMAVVRLAGIDRLLNVNELFQAAVSNLESTAPPSATRFSGVVSPTSTESTEKKKMTHSDRRNYV